MDVSSNMTFMLVLYFCCWDLTDISEAFSGLGHSHKVWFLTNTSEDFWNVEFQDVVRVHWCFSPRLSALHPVYQAGPIVPDWKSNPSAQLGRLGEAICQPDWEKLSVCLVGNINLAIRLTFPVCHLLCRWLRAVMPIGRWRQIHDQIGAISRSKWLS